MQELEKRYKVSADITLKKGCSFEYIISQIKVPGVILCVKDGYQLLFYKSIDEIPRNLIHITNPKINKDVSTVEYHWRSVDDDSLYVLFDLSISILLSEREEDELRARPITVDISIDRENIDTYIKL